MTEKDVLELLYSVFRRAYWRSDERTDAETLIANLQDIVLEELRALDEQV